MWWLLTLVLAENVCVLVLTMMWLFLCSSFSGLLCTVLGVMRLITNLWAVLSKWLLAIRVMLLLRLCFTSVVAIPSTLGTFGVLVGLMQWTMIMLLVWTVFDRMVVKVSDLLLNMCVGFLKWAWLRLVSPSM